MGQPVPATPPPVGKAALTSLDSTLEPATRQDLARVARLWIKVKERGNRVVVVTGSGPNLHEGVTTMLAALVAAGLVDGIITSSAVVGHEMAGTLERVRRVEGAKLGLPPQVLSADGKVEVSLLGALDLERVGRDTVIDLDLYRRMLSASGNEIIKVAGNLAYPTGLWAERLARHLEPLAKGAGLPLEAVAGLGADPLTMLGACARRGAPCLVSVPQLVGGGQIGLAVGDAISVSRRSELVAELLAGADLIVESGLALAQEIHDGPFELFTGHGLWARHEGLPTFSLRDKALVRIDLDPTIRQIWEKERQGREVAHSIDQGLPKACHLNLPFRMEMSGFARLPGSLPLIGDLGVLWPLLAVKVAKSLGVKPAFVCYKQGFALGESLRQFIVSQVRPVDPSAVVQALKKDKTRDGRMRL
ncbi:conserved hypothetical protein [Desulfarculales bacterium]